METPLYSYITINYIFLRSSFNPNPFPCSDQTLTCDGDGEQTALRGEVLRISRDVINTAVASLVGGLCSREQEVGRVIDSWL
ncbi:hypothetical protein F7725_017755 [Dissostichus mawsoni]|uniref:Uncharacterized protein n=1 Tax=Dissostichus mawsoni TaxID=36200 RepID=A0A7J5XSG6_DISMA|nr:hypothetical protein F7725_017755 [Dissostichus mawsoni]